MSTPLEEYLAAKQSDVSASASSSTTNLVNARSPTKPIVRRGTISRQSPTKSLHPGTTVSPTKSMTYHSSESTPSLHLGNSSRVRGSRRLMMILLA
ncbi:hypothetical protein BKA69DRAFT_806272 [Paraphysoderma sedebokerense]|nr:hypothetical protein BKA69DRAFT_806272 [Paraphysoderma sedebokerense]